MSRPENAFLQGLSDQSYRALEKHLEPVKLELATTLRRAGERVHWVHFPETALISLLAMNSDGHTVETSMAGNEGADGIAEACGSGVSTLEVQVQVDGKAWRVAPKIICELVAADPDFSRRCWMLIEFQMTESRQSALCNAMHMVEARFARWMLESYDRTAGRNPLPMTQEFMAAMLGVQRTTVSTFASQLQKTGLLDYRRGQVELRDLAGLEQRACECRGVTREQRGRLGLMLRDGGNC